MKKKILCGLCAAAVLLLSFSIFAAATHINIREDDTGIAQALPTNFGASPNGISGRGMMGGARTAPDGEYDNGTMNGGIIGGENGTPDGGVVGGENGTTDTPMGVLPGGDATPNNPADGENGTTNDGINDGTNDENGGIIDDVTDGVEDMLPDTNVPDEDIGGAAPDNDGDGITNAGDPDDDGDKIPDAMDPDADGDKVDDTDEATGIVGIVLAVIIVVAIIAIILAVVPKKNKK